jgi:hypothetical protein
MEPEQATAHGQGDPSPEPVAQERLSAAVNRSRELRRRTQRVAAALSETERDLAGTLHALAERDRERGNDAAADRRDAAAREAEQFAEVERLRAGGEVADREPPETSRQTPASTRPASSPS